MNLPTAAPPTQPMLAAERRASIGLALIFALRMLGLFLVMPVLPLEAPHYLAHSAWWRDPNTGHASAAAMGAAMGIYGLTQASLQLPWGIASDYWGRKRVIAMGLLLFAAGSIVAARAHTVEGLIWGRALQGAGAISAALTALLADLTRDATRTRAMAMIGASIALVFALALVSAPLLNKQMGLAGIFWLMAALTVPAYAVLFYLVPAEPLARQSSMASTPLGQQAHTPISWGAVLRDGTLLRLNAGVCILHAVQIAMWMVIPRLLEQAGLPRQQHGQVYLPAVGAALVLMLVTLFPLERRGKLRLAFLFAIVLLLIVQIALAGSAWHATQGTTVSIWQIGLMLLLFFTGFNVLEASQPSLVSRYAPPPARGMALGLYNTAQSLGLFAGGAIGGLLAHTAGGSVLFMGTAALLIGWLLLSWRLPMPTAQLASPMYAHSATAPSAPNPPAD